MLDPKDWPTILQAQQHKWLQDLSKNNHTLNPSVVQALASFKDYSDMRKLLCEVLSFTLLHKQIKELAKNLKKWTRMGPEKSLSLP